MSRGRAVSLLLLPAALVLLPGRVRADLNGTPHDLASQGYDVLKDQKARRVCRPCHLPLGQESGSFLEGVPRSLSKYDASTLTCFSCHDGITFVSAEVDATATAFDPRSHGNAEGDYRERLGEEAFTAFPDLGGRMMSCVVCHTPHDSDYRPFLRQDLEALCRGCHGDKVPQGEGGASLGGNHSLLASPLESAKPEMPLDTDPRMRVPFPAPYPPSGGKTSRGTHWDLGGHLSEGAGGLLLCVTCHTVHGDEGNPPSANLVSVDPVRREADLFCEACHRGQRADGAPSPLHPNPGGTKTARTYHPGDDVTTGMSGQQLPTVIPAGWPLGSEGTRTLLCTTCHTAHGGWKGSAILRTPPTAPSFCEECHTQLPLEYHHPTDPESKGACAPDLPVPVYGEARQGIQCADCHVAHNAGLGKEDEKEYVPILKEPYASSGYCLSCHSEEDPTCGGTEGWMASHFMGDPTLDETYADKAPPLKTDAWPESGLLSVYEGANGKGVGCLSCHAFRPGAVTSGDDGQSPYLLARAGNMIEWDEEEEGQGEDNYLCTGCHSASPGTKGEGHTHPLMSADMSEDETGPQPPVTVTPGGKINCDTCHRSHNAPTAGGYYILEVVGGENLDPQAVKPPIDFTPLCHKCHLASEY